MANNPNAKANLGPPWQPGKSGNPGGITAETKARITANAEAAVRIRAALLAKIETMIDPETGGFMDDMSGELLKLLKDSEDRGLGAPTAKTAFTDADGNDIPASLTLNIVRSPGS